MRRIAVLALVALVAALLFWGLPADRSTAQWLPERNEKQTPLPPVPENLAIATFANGCFWCTESDFDKVEGVVATYSGYTGGQVKNPTYKQVGSGSTGHVEALRVVYDPKKVSYEKLLDVYWHNTDVTDDGGQFCDRGSEYQPAIFVHTPEQRRLAEASKAAFERSGKFKKVVVPIRDAAEFTPAEDYHQDFYQKNPGHYFRYRLGCGRDYRLEELWGPKPKG
ncbi:MAG: peptide-methionine (S)-S-oxide reductase MsrA [Hyphomicrobiaceae bacterium]